MESDAFSQLCSVELKEFARRHGLRFIQRRCPLRTYTATLRSNRISIRFEYERYGNTIFVSIAPVRFGLTLWWKRIDSEAIFAASFPPGRIEREDLTTLRDEKYFCLLINRFCTELENSAPDFLNGDFSRLHSAQIVRKQGVTERRRLIDRITG